MQSAHIDPHSISAKTRQAVDGAQVWYGFEMASRHSEWTHDFVPAEAVDIRRALEHALATGRDVMDLTAADFPLPVLGARLRKIRAEVLHGREFALIRGFSLDSMSAREAAISYWGVGLHLGSAVSQNSENQLLGHVRDTGREHADPTARGYQTRARLPYHTDYADLVSLLCLSASQSGGASGIVSSITIFNEMTKRRPDLVAALTEPVFHTCWGAVPQGEDPWIGVPVFNPWGRTVITCYVRSAVRKAQHLPGVPRLTESQIEAMDLIDTLADNPDLHLDMTFEEGDIQILNNHWIMHSRGEFSDGGSPERQRHLLRLWLACADGPPLPPAITDGFLGCTANGRPEGIRMPGLPLTLQLEVDEAENSVGRA